MEVGVLEEGISLHAAVVVATNRLRVCLGEAGVDAEETWFRRSRAGVFPVVAVGAAVEASAMTTSVKSWTETMPTLQKTHCKKTLLIATKNNLCAQPQPTTKDQPVEEA